MFFVSFVSKERKHYVFHIFHSVIFSSSFQITLIKKEIRRKKNDFLLLWLAIFRACSETHFLKGICISADLVKTLVECLWRRIEMSVNINDGSRKWRQRVIDRTKRFFFKKKNALYTDLHGSKVIVKISKSI